MRTSTVLSLPLQLVFPDADPDRPGVPLQDRLLALPINIKLGWKGLEKLITTARSLLTSGPGPNVIKLLRIFVISQCLSVASFSSLFQCLLVKQEPTLLKNISDATLQDRLLDLSTNNRLGWKGLPDTTTLVFTIIRNLRP